MTDFWYDFSGKAMCSSRALASSPLVLFSKIVNRGKSFFSVDPIWRDSKGIYGGISHRMRKKQGYNRTRHAPNSLISCSFSSELSHPGPFSLVLHRAIQWNLNLRVWSQIEIFFVDVFTVSRFLHLHSFALIRHIAFYLPLSLSLSSSLCRWCA